MELLILFGAVLVLAQGSVVAPSGDLVTLKSGVTYKKEVLKECVKTPYHLAIDRDTNTLFFSYTAKEDEYYKVIHINLKDKTSGTIFGIADGFANAVDSDNKIVYIGGRDGIYKYDYNTEKATKLNITNLNIWQMFYKDGLYFTSYPDEKAYHYKNGVVRLVPELADKSAKLAAVDDDGIVYYNHDGVLYKIINGKITNLGDFRVSAFNTDAEGNVFFSTYGAIYRIIRGDIQRVVEIPNLWGFAIESDNKIIYADKNKIVRLTLTNEMCHQQMKLPIVFEAVPAPAQSSVVAPSSDLVTLNGVTYKKEVLKENVESPYHLAIDRDTNTLFFRYTANEIFECFKIMYINLKDKTSGKLSGIGGGFANAVDSDNKIVYIGGRDGIYKYDYNTEKATKLNITDRNIWQMFYSYKDGLYFTSYPDEKAYLYKNSVVRLVPELADKSAMTVAVDNDGVIYFTHTGVLHKIIDGEIINIRDFHVYERKYLKAFAFNTDAEGNLFFSTNEAIYRIVRGDIELVVEIPILMGFAIESNNTIIYAADNKIVRLTIVKPTNELCQ